jgi:hypothetical protein
MAFFSMIFRGEHNFTRVAPLHPLDVGAGFRGGQPVQIRLCTPFRPAAGGNSIKHAAAPPKDAGVTLLDRWRPPFAGSSLDKPFAGVSKCSSDAGQKEQCSGLESPSCAGVLLHGSLCLTVDPWGVMGTSRGLSAGLHVSWSRRSSMSGGAAAYGGRCLATGYSLGDPLSVKVEPDPRCWVFHSGPAAPAPEHVIDPAAVQLPGSAATALRALLPAAPDDLEECVLSREQGERVAGLTPGGLHLSHCVAGTEGGFWHPKAWALDYLPL